MIPLMMPSLPLPAITLSTLTSYALCQDFAQIEAAIRIEIERGEGVRHALDGLGRCTQRVLVGGELGDVAEAVLLADAFDRAPGFVRPQRLYIRRYKWHLLHFTLPPLSGAGCGAMRPAAAKAWYDRPSRFI